MQFFPEAGPAQRPDRPLRRRRRPDCPAPRYRPTAVFGSEGVYGLVSNSDVALALGDTLVAGESQGEMTESTSSYTTGPPWQPGGPCTPKSKAPVSSTSMPAPTTRSPSTSRTTNPYPEPSRQRRPSKIYGVVFRTLTEHGGMAILLGGAVLRLRRQAERPPLSAGKPKWAVQRKLSKAIKISLKPSPLSATNEKTWPKPGPQREIHHCGCSAGDGVQTGHPQ